MRRISRTGRDRGRCLTAVLALPVSAMLLAGCSLARPEAAQEEQGRFAGFYLVCYEDDTAAGIGAPEEALFARHDGTGGAYTFPGMEGGYSLFLVQGTMEDGSEYTEVVSDMAPAEEGQHILETEEGTASRISGTVYYGSPLADTDWDAYEDDGRVWKCYRVYQAADGRVYIDGSGNSFHGSGGFGYHESQTWTTAENGESVTESMDASVKVEPADRLRSLAVTQFDGNHAVIRSEEVKTGDGSQRNLPEVVCEKEAAWVLVEETGADGTVRTVYNVPQDGEEPVSHPVILLDEAGLGRLAYLTIR